jgi:hypothetical protein
MMMRGVTEEQLSDPKTIEYKLRHYKPVRTYRYFPLIPRLKKLIRHPVFSHLFRWAMNNLLNSDPDVVDDIHQSPMYHQFVSRFPTSGPNKVCDLRIGLGLSADRASISKHKMRADHAVLPFLLMIVEWPIWVRNREKFLLISGIPPKEVTKPQVYFGNSFIHISIN